jgi:hypothetical protein
VVGFGGTIAAPGVTGVGFGSADGATTGPLPEGALFGNPPKFGRVEAGFVATEGTTRAGIAGLVGVDAVFELKEGLVVTIPAPVVAFLELPGGAPGTGLLGDICPAWGLVEGTGDAGGLVGVGRTVQI